MPAPRIPRSILICQGNIVLRTPFPLKYFRGYGTLGQINRCLKALTIAYIVLTEFLFLYYTTPLLLLPPLGGIVMIGIIVG